MDLKKIITVVVIFSLSLITATPVAKDQRDYTIKNQPTPSIVGGETAPDGYAKHMVALLVGDYFTWVTCGGSLITKKHVLTAAHCVEVFVVWDRLMETYRGAMGSNKWNESNVIIHFKSYDIHPGWSWETLKNDISILTADSEITFNDRIAPIRLNLDFVDSRMASFVTGWGDLELFGESPEELKILHINALSSRECSVRMWLAAISEDGRPPPFDTSLEICALHSVGHGMCHGDSGSALVHGDSGLQTGIVSWGYPCARGHPDVFVRVSAYKHYILDIVGELP